jgi:hypothetical protein
MVRPPVALLAPVFSEVRGFQQSIAVGAHDVGRFVASECEPCEFLNHHPLTGGLPPRMWTARPRQSVRSLKSAVLVILYPIAYPNTVGGSNISKASAYFGTIIC